MRLYDRRYRIVITNNNEEIVITNVGQQDYLRVAFNAYQSSSYGASTLELHIYNLNPSNRQRIFNMSKPGAFPRITFSVGYGDVLLPVFSGVINRAVINHIAPDYRATIFAQTNQLAKDIDTKISVNGSNYDARIALIRAMGLTPGQISTSKTDVGESPLPYVFAGNLYYKLKELLDEDEYIIHSEGVLNIKRLSDAPKDAHVISYDSNLLSIINYYFNDIYNNSTIQKIVTARIIYTPEIRLDDAIQLYTKLSPDLDGRYRVASIIGFGDTDLVGEGWVQRIELYGGGR